MSDILGPSEDVPGGLHSPSVPPELAQGFLHIRVPSRVAGLV